MEGVCNYNAMVSMTTSFENLFGTMKFTSKTQEETFKEMFKCYFSDIPANFYRNQFDLATQYPGTSFEDWSSFLQHQAFDNWKSKQISIIASTETDVALAGGGLRDKESLNLLRARQDILATENADTKPTIIVMPESLFFKEDD